MVSHGNREQVCRQVSDAVAQVLGSGWWGGGRLLPAEKVMEELKAEGVKFRQCLFTPMVTLWTFLAQVMGPDRSCRAAVAKLQAWMATQQSREGLAAQGVDGDLAAPCWTPRGIASRRSPMPLLTVPRNQARRKLAREWPSLKAQQAGQREVAA